MNPLDVDSEKLYGRYQSAYIERQQRTERLIAIGQMAGGVTHELRNPLNVVKTSVYYLRNAKNPSQEKTSEHLQRIERQVGLADSVITAFSDFANLPFPQVTSVRIDMSIAEALEITSLPPWIEVCSNVSADLPSVLADALQLRIVLLNLIRNARDAMPEGGRLTVTACQADGFLNIAITDTGGGISRETLGRIMEPLYSTKSRGLGLGLAIARAIIEKHRGQILVNSTPGEGSTFTVRLPAASTNTPSETG